MPVVSEDELANKVKIRYNTDMQLAMIRLIYLE